MTTTPSPFALGMPDQSRILTINGGSSSLKFALFDRDHPPRRLLSGRIERIGLTDARFVVAGTESDRKEDYRVAAPNSSAASDLLIDWLEHSIGFAAVAVIGHRVVHGGGRYNQPECVTAELIEELRRFIPFDPDHLPDEIATIEAFRQRASALPQIACFDTAFHQHMPRVARIVPIPRRFEADGVRRYGFHGLSYAYLMEELARVADEGEALGRVILAHLGSGASLAAVRDGRSIDTTMGFTPASGLIMSTRTGDLDPGLVRFLLQNQGRTAEQFDNLVNRESGLLGVSETSSDVRDLLAQRAVDSRAAEAIDLFCYHVKKGIGAFAAVLGGLDSLVFAGGIGENASEIRRRICDDLGFLGITLDEERNASGNPLISSAESTTRVRVIRTDEESMIARAAAHLTPRRS